MNMDIILEKNNINDIGSLIDKLKTKIDEYHKEVNNKYQKYSENTIGSTSSETTSIEDTATKIANEPKKEEILKIKDEQTIKDNISPLRNYIEYLKNESKNNKYILNDDTVISKLKKIYNNCKELKISIDNDINEINKYDNKEMIIKKMILEKNVSLLEDIIKHMTELYEINGLNIKTALKNII
jgi:hypothetical protein